MGVAPGSSAEKAGLARGDIVLSAGARRVASEADVVAALALTPAGKALRLTVLRGGSADDARRAGCRMRRNR